MSIGSSDVESLAAMLLTASARIVPAVVAATRVSITDLEQTWRANATVTSGRHGWRYPYSITSDVGFGVGLSSTIAGVAGPDAAFPQGGMGLGFEYGSVNQPPHLDGTRAMDVVAPRYAAALSTALASVLGAR